MGFYSWLTLRGQVLLPAVAPFDAACCGVSHHLTSLLVPRSPHNCTSRSPPLLPATARCFSVLFAPVVFSSDFAATPHLFWSRRLVRASLLESSAVDSVLRCICAPSTLLCLSLESLASNSSLELVSLCRLVSSLARSSSVLDQFRALEQPNLPPYNTFVQPST